MKLEMVIIVNFLESSIDRLNIHFRLDHCLFGLNSEALALTICCRSGWAPDWQVKGYSQGRRNENKTNVRYSLIGQRPGMEPGSHCLNQIARLLISANKPKQSCKCNGQDSRHRSRVKKNSMEGARFQARSGPGKLHVLERRLVSNCRLSAIFSHRKTCFFANTII